ncbi:MAG: PTS sugar transporter subunit IIA [Pseudomonadales bacterium]|nr:PTS sugar transporter subunit IIA [Pseudomonadales bacterium]
MVDITRILRRDCTLTDVGAQSRKRALELASDLIAAHVPELSARALFDGLMTRERLGSTGLGEGVAIPHCRMPCPAITGALLKLAQPVEFDALDDQPVDLIFVLVVPPEETSAHLETLAALARVFQNPDYRTRLRNQSSGDALFDEFVGIMRAEGA